jgi:hypothetical protein
MLEPVQLGREFELTNGGKVENLGWPTSVMKR